MCVGVNDLMDSLGETNELDLFDNKIVKDFYEFQWQNYAMHIHYFGAAIHFIYSVVFITYVNEVYLYRNYEYRVEMLYVMMVAKLYPIFYDSL